MYKAVDLPPNLSTQSFSEIWEEFRQHRKEIRHSLTPTSERRLLIKLSRFPVATAIKMVEQSIEAGWQGIFEIKEQSPRSRSFESPPAPRPTSTYFCPKCNTQHPLMQPCVSSDVRILSTVGDLAARMAVKEALK